MPTQTYVKVKDFNPPRVDEELQPLALPTHAVGFEGFEPTGVVERVTPFAEATRVVGRRTVEGVTTVDTAARGEVRIESRTALTPAQVSAVEGVLDAHLDTVDSASQADKRAEINDIATLRAAFDAGIADPTLALSTKFLLRELGEDV